MPFTADHYGASGVYFMPRRANKQLVFGSIDHRFESEVVENPDDFPTHLDKDVEQDYLSCLLHRLPTLPTSGKVIGFSHMYTVNQEGQGIKEDRRKGMREDEAKLEAQPPRGNQCGQSDVAVRVQ